jgi:hypothetical protein
MDIASDVPVRVLLARRLALVRAPESERPVF